MRIESVGRRVPWRGMARLVSVGILHGYGDPVGGIGRKSYIRSLEEAGVIRDGG